MAPELTGSNGVFQGGAIDHVRSRRTVLIDTQMNTIGQKDRLIASQIIVMAAQAATQASPLL